MQGTVLKIAVEAGASVAAGTLIAVIEAMKMENEITAHKAGTVDGAADLGRLVGRLGRHARGDRVRRERRLARASADEADDVTRLLIAFRDWLGEDQPGEDSFAASVARLIADPATEFLLAAVEPGSPPCGVCQLRFRHSVWTDAPDCWLEDLYVEQQARGSGVGRALVELAFERADRARRAADRARHQRAQRGAIALYESLGFSASSKAHGELSGRDVFMGRRLR